MTASLLMIVRDEEANLPACLESCAGLFGDLVVVDTGSADGTREIARAAGARVFDFPWCDDFAAARNESLRLARGEWIFWMDADDRLDAVNRERLGDLLGRLDSGAAYQMRVESSDALGALPMRWQMRLFPNRDSLRWRGRVHEEMALDADLREVAADVVVQHFGYRDASALAAKMARNLRLLWLKLEDDPGDARTLFHLGGALLNADRAGEAYDMLLRCTAGGELPAWLPAAMYLRALAAQRLGVGDADAVEWLRRAGSEEAGLLLGRLVAQGVWC